MLITQGHEYVIEGESVTIKNLMIDKILNSSKLLLTILFFLITFGFYQYNSLPRESDPDISLPVIYVSLYHKGISNGFRKTFD